MILTNFTTWDDTNTPVSHKNFKFISFVGVNVHKNVIILSYNVSLWVFEVLFGPLVKLKIDQDSWDSRLHRKNNF